VGRVGRVRAESVESLDPALDDGQAGRVPDGERAPEMCEPVVAEDVKALRVEHAAVRDQRGVFVAPASGGDAQLELKLAVDRIHLAGVLPADRYTLLPLEILVYAQQAHFFACRSVNYLRGW